MTIVKCDCGTTIDLDMPATLQNLIDKREDNPLSEHLKKCKGKKNAE